MSVFRIEKNKNYTVMSNHHLRNKELSLKSKGLLSLMLSLPEEWDYTLTKGLHLVGSMLRKRTSEEKALLLAELVEKVWPKIEKGEMKPSIYKVLPLEDANEALDILERGENIGKVVLRVCNE